jgi:hypothetical protein
MEVVGQHGSLVSSAGDLDRAAPLSTEESVLAAHASLQLVLKTLTGFPFDSLLASTPFPPATTACRPATTTAGGVSGGKELSQKQKKRRQYNAQHYSNKKQKKDEGETAMAAMDVLRQRVSEAEEHLAALVAEKKVLRRRLADLEAEEIASAVTASPEGEAEEHAAAVTASLEGWVEHK